MPAASGFARFDAATVESLPFPDAAAEDPVLIRLAREAMNGEPAPTELDRRVASLLRLDLARSDEGPC